MSTSHLPFLHRLANLAALSVMLVGGVVLFGWMKHIPALSQETNDLLPMTPSAAFSFIFTGAALFLLQPEKPSTLRRWVGQILALGGMLLGGLMLFSYWYVSSRALAGPGFCRAGCV